MMRKVLLLGVMFFISTVVFANDYTQSLKQANEALSSQNYDNAIGLYHDILSDGYESSSLLYNLGLAYFRKEDYGRAVLYWERTLQLAPNDQDTKHNLKLVRTQFLKNQLDIIPQSFLERSWTNLVNVTSLNIWTILSLIIFWVGAVGLFFWLKAKERKYRKLGFIVGLSSLFLGALISIFAYSRFRTDYITQNAVTIAKEAAFRLGPEEVSDIELILYPGLKVAIISDFDSWYKVKLSDGRIGWIDKESVTII